MALTDILARTNLKLALLTSNRLRHMWLAHHLSSGHDLRLVVAEKKGNESQMVGNTSEETKVLREHFLSLEQAQVRHFGDISGFPESADVMHVERGGVNCESIISALKLAEVDAVAVFGCGIIKPSVFDALNVPFVNAHQGISPYYRGSGTNFWPFVNKELALVGVTMHFLDAGIDTGAIICHGRPCIELEDGMHDIGCKVVKKSGKLFVEVFSLLGQGVTFTAVPQIRKGKLYQRKDFTSEAVLTARFNIEQGLIRDYIEGRVKSIGAQIIELV